MRTVLMHLLPLGPHSAEVTEGTQICVSGQKNSLIDYIDLLYVIVLMTFMQKSILLECETQVESLLANVFENYKSLDELSPTGMSDSLTTIPDAAPPALAPAVQLYCLLHDILAQDGQTILQKYLQVMEDLMHCLFALWNK